jgi:hypothetical protein
MKETEPCRQCGAETDIEELDNNEELFGERICNNCAEVYEAEEDMED